jgi:hypothetical protein
MMTLPSTQEPIVANRSFVDFSSVMQSGSFERAEFSFCFGSPLLTDYSAHSPFYSIVSRVGLLIILCILKGSTQRGYSSFFRKVRRRHVRGVVSVEFLGGRSPRNTVPLLVSSIIPLRRNHDILVLAIQILSVNYLNLEGSGIVDKYLFLVSIRRRRPNERWSRSMTSPSDNLSICVDAIYNLNADQ